MAEAFSRTSSVDETEEEVFEITDFTTVSDWEKFIAQISEAISDWQLTCIEHVRPLKKNELTLGSWEQITKEIRFSNAIFMLTLYRLKQSGAEEVYLEESDTSLEDEIHFPVYMDDMMSTENDFPPRAHCLVRWYGFRSFLVLSLITTGTMNSDGLTSESKCNLLLSSVCIVLSESGCEVPIFVQIQQNWRKMFTGRCIGTGMQTEFDMVHLKKCPPQYQHLSGLLHIFKSKIGRPVSPVQISARFTYILSKWGEKGVWPREQVDPDIAAQTFDSFMSGCLDDPISDLQLSAVWPSITEDMIFENEVHSDFNPISAPVWAIRLHYTDNPECLLSGYLKELIKLRNCNETFSSLITTSTVKVQNTDIGQALSKITDSSHKVKQMVPLMPGLTSGISKIKSSTSMWASRMRYSSHSVGPISLPMMELIMDFLLTEISDEEVLQEIDDTGKETFIHELEHRLKSAPKDSLTYRLALCITVINFCHGGISAIAQVWHEFVQEMRYRFENGVLITGIKTENPDLRCCLLHQKLQMLNCCIKHKIAREKGQDHENSKVENDVANESIASTSSVNENLEQNSVLSDTSVNGDEGNTSEVQCNEAAADSDIGHCENEEISNTPPDTVPRQESATSLESQESSGWQEEASSIDDDEFFECDDGSDGLVIEQEKGVDEEETITGEMPDEKLLENDQTTHKDDTETDNNLSDQETDKDITDENDVTISLLSDEAVSVKINKTDDDPMYKKAKAIGRWKTFGSYRLLHHDAPLFIPITQEPAPLTEDALEEQTKIFSSLGDSAEGAVLRRRMQSASLLSDMESFKAANPGCVLDDFVRWYSPRDYEEHTSESGEVIGSLSDRMKIPGNLWQTMWNTAKSIPARRQKRLFDDTKEGEKVLHFLSSLQPKDLAMLLLPMCYHESILILKSKSDSSVPSVPKLCEQILSQSCKLFQTNFRDKWAEMDDIFQKIQFSETLIGRASSLKHKFSKVKDCDAFVRRILEHPEVILEGAANGEVGKIVEQYFLDQSAAIAVMHSHSDDKPESHTISLPPPGGREYILRNIASRPSAQSRPLPHRLYVVLLKNEFRLAGAFSSDTVFF